MQLVEELVEVLVVREQHVAADVVGEAVGARLARREAADLVRASSITKFV